MITAEQQQQVVKHSGLAYYMINRLWTRVPDLQEFSEEKDDMYQEAFISMCHAVAKYKEGRGARLSTYASKAIYLRLMKKLSVERTYPNKRKLRKKLYFAHTIPTDEFIPAVFANQKLLDTKDMDEQAVLDNLEEAKYLLSKLTPKEQYIIKAHFGIDMEPLRLEALAQKMNTNRETLRKCTIPLILNKLKKYTKQEVL